MTAPKHAEKQMAIQLRSQGLSIKEIVDRINVSKSSVSTWVSHVKLNTFQVRCLKGRCSPKVSKGRAAACKKNKEKYEAIRQHARLIGYNEALGAPLHVAGCMLYWAEGSKSMNQVSMTNTDPHLLAKFAEFLLFLGVQPEKLVFSCRVHSTPGNASIKQCQKFWSLKMNIPEEKIKVFKANDSRGDSKKKSRYPHGVGRLSVYDVSIVQRIYGGIEKYAGVQMVFGRK